MIAGVTRRGESMTMTMMAMGCLTVQRMTTTREWSEEDSQKGTKK